MIPWFTLDIFDQVDDKTNGFNTLFGEIVDKHAPIKEMTFNHKGNPSITSVVRGEINMWNKLLRRARRTRSESNWLALKIKRKEVKKMIRNAELEFVQNKLTECQEKHGAMWKILRNYAPTSRAPTSI